ncbi:hypothetical protein AUK15_01690 [Candidatus Nomurabacteria bacterium CG2_30_43_9]|uniref:Uncharacterized protein n=2 Tax=Parcubacteria group TaxID=1794811 RepID=A0A2M7QNQ6_9BACT|nr:MAG: hypothetical protein AUK15_01690 [Candidatus Nomurabacteria bacterium CG2_30_43_9]PIY73963.1 MAG: hypothetical protein COY85_04565 [Candidatus Portnoybacteria bacterium CG_4_10_14_0_8_um_filter_40_50]
MTNFVSGVENKESHWIVRLKKHYLQALSLNIQQRKRFLLKIVYNKGKFQKSKKKSYHEDNA